MKYFFRAFQLYFKFSGRATRREFWYYTLFYSLFLALFWTTYFWSFFADINAAGYSIYGSVPISASQLSQTTKILAIALNVYFWGTLIPCLAISVRRLHDVGDNGWFMLLPVYNIVQYCTKGEEGTNYYGPDPSNPQFEFELEHPDGTEMDVQQLKEI